MKTLAVLGLAAIVTLLGAISFFPPHAAFFVGALAVILFPGIIATNLIAPSSTELETLAERLVIWFVVGTGILGALGFAGLIFHAKLSHLILITTVGYAFVTILVFARKISAPTAKDSRGLSPRHRRWLVTAVLFAVAVGAALLTLLSQRDADDWFYLAHIRDYVANHPLGSEDAIFNMGGPASARQWFGGAWWFVEALVSKVTGVDLVTGHQVYLPLLVLPFAVFAWFALSKQLFRSYKTALLACLLQVFFYLSSAVPYRTAGWMFFCRTAQDKTVACFLIAPVAAALAVRFINQATEGGVWKKREFYVLYWLALIVSVLLYPLGPVWCGLFVIPFALVEWLRAGNRRSAHILIMLVLPFLVCAAFLAFGRGVVMESMEIPQPTPGPASQLLSSFYFPGEEVSSFTWFDPPIEASYPITWLFTERFQICNPLYITRYPLAIGGLVLSFLLIPYFKSHTSARFLLSLTFSILFFAFTPVGAAATAGLVTRKMVCPLSWIFPWGLTIAFLLSRMRLRLLWAWLIVFMVILALARGNPQNYATSLSSRKAHNRPSPEVVDAFRFLDSEPSPQGVILASKRTSKMIAAFVPDAYPAIFRRTGLIDITTLRQLLNEQELGESALLEIRQRPIRYVLIGKWRPLAEALTRRPDVFSLVYQNDTHCIWKVSPDIRQPTTIHQD